MFRATCLMLIAVVGISTAVLAEDLPTTSLQILPAEVANTYFHLAHQHRSAWTFELDLRAHSDLAWWNHASSPDLK